MNLSKIEASLVHIANSRPIGDYRVTLSQNNTTQSFRGFY